MMNAKAVKEQSVQTNRLLHHQREAQFPHSRCKTNAARPTLECSSWEILGTGSLSSTCLNTLHAKIADCLISLIMCHITKANFAIISKLTVSNLCEENLQQSARRLYFLTSVVNQLPPYCAQLQTEWRSDWVISITWHMLLSPHKAAVNLCARAEHEPAFLARRATSRML